MIELRDYQKQAPDAAVKAFQSKKKSNGLIIVSTGGGKSLIIADIASRPDTKFCKGAKLRNNRLWLLFCICWL